MYAIVDIETTGGSATYHKITEICVLLHDGKEVVQRFHSLINPEQPIPYNITMLTGITNEMVADAPRFFEVAKEIYQITDKAIFVAHNVNFDFSFLKKEFEELGGEFKRQKLCTVRLSRKLLPGLRSYSLGNLCESIGIAIEDRHRAHGDAEATAQLFSMLLDLDKDQAFIKHSLKKNSKETTLPPNISKELYDALPEKTGVYYFHDAAGKVIYVGKATNIKDRVCAHFAGNTHTKSRSLFLNTIFDVSYEETGSELIALLLENEAIKKHYPRYNRTNKTFVLNVGYYIYEDQNGYYRLAINRTGKRDKPVLTFKNQTEAVTHALSKIKKHGLCLRLCNIIPSAQQCTYDHIEQTGHYCSVCHDQQDPEEYNRLFTEAFLNTRHERSFVVQTNGRSREEKGFVWVEKGRYLGFGYIPESDTIGHIDEMRDYLRSCYDTQDSQTIIDSHLKKAKLLAKEPVAVYYCK
jgi:DNA polymerase III subunit epsilon